MKVLQFDVLKRFLPAASLDQLVEEYRKARRGVSATSRFDKLAKPITEEETAALEAYLDKQVSLQKYAEGAQLKLSKVYGLAASAALKMAYFQSLGK